MAVRELSGSVGEAGENAGDNVFTVQMLLNQVGPGAGGPNPPLQVDGLVGPKTNGAIRGFQQTRLGFQDGLVEPGQVTFTALKGFFTSPAEFPDEAVAGPGVVRPHRLVYRDVRLLGSRPAGDTVIEVNFDTPLQWFLDSAKDTAAHTADPVRLKIMAHGAPAFVQFCRENLTIANLGVHRPRRRGRQRVPLPHGPAPQHVRPRLDRDPVLHTGIGRLRAGLRPVGGHGADIRSTRRRHQRRARTTLLTARRTPHRCGGSSSSGVTLRPPRTAGRPWVSRSIRRSPRVQDVLLLVEVLVRLPREAASLEQRGRQAPAVTVLVVGFQSPALCLTTRSRYHSALSLSVRRWVS